MSTHWKGMEPYKQCGVCGTLRPDAALELPFKGSATLVCTDKAWCVEQAKAKDRAQMKNGTHKSVLDEK